MESKTKTPLWYTISFDDITAKIEADARICGCIIISLRFYMSDTRKSRIINETAGQVEKIFYDEMKIYAEKLCKKTNHFQHHSIYVQQINEKLSKKSLCESELYIYPKQQFLWQNKNKGEIAQMIEAEDIALELITKTDETIKKVYKIIAE